MIRHFSLAVVVVLARPWAAPAQTPPCPEFPVNEYTTSDQTAARVASAPNGDFVVVWTSFRDPSDSEIIGRHYDASAQPRGPAFLVNTYTTGHQSNPDVAIDGSGNFVVVWQGAGNGDPSGIFGQRYDASGAPQGGEFQVHTTGSTTGTFFTYGLLNPAVASEPSGAFVVAWARDAYGGPLAIHGQRYAGGVRQGAEFQVNTSYSGNQVRPAVSIEPAGGSVIVWGRTGGFNGLPVSVHGRRFGPSGAPLGDEFAVVDPPNIAQAAEPKVAHGPNGDFLVVWRTVFQNPDGSRIFGKRFNSSGVAQGSDFRINVTPISGSLPAVAGSPTGYVVAWDIGDVLARRVDPSGVPLGSEFRVNTYTTAQQAGVSVAPTLNGGFVAVWSSAGQDGDGSGVFGSLECARLYTVSPCRLVDTRDPPGTPLAANTSRVFTVTGSCGIPADARAVVVNATAVNPTDFGTLRLHPAGGAAPLASSLNFTAGVTRANNAVARLGADGQIAVQCDMPPASAGTTHFALDVYGYFKR